MANPEHLKILEQGVEAWNNWLWDNKVSPNLSGANLSEANLIRADLSGADLTRANLGGANLTKAHLTEVNLRGANLRRAFLDNAELNRADLTKADLREANLREAILCPANLVEADLSRANLSRAKLVGSNLVMANLTEANLRGTFLTSAFLSEANLSRADLRGADLIKADLSNADLSEADLSSANLIKADLNGTLLRNTKFHIAQLGDTVFGNVNLSDVDGLEKADHRGLSTIGTNTLKKSKGRIPKAFLRGCGLSDWEIESAKLYKPDLENQEIDEILYNMHDLRAHQALQISPLFISYSHADSTFVDSVEKQLNRKGIRFWRDVHHATAGRLEKQIDTAIRHNPTVLVILSGNSTKSDWVEHEVRTARDLEKELDRDVLCPIALDDSWKSARWPARIMEQLMEYNILDFSRWEDNKEFEKQFGKLIDGLDIFYK